MKRVLAVTAVLLTFPTMAFIQNPGRGSSAPPQTGVQKELIALDQQIGTVREKAFFSRVLTDDFMFIGGDGGVQNKAQFIADIKEGPASPPDPTPDTYAVHVYGDAAFLSHRDEARHVGHMFIRQQGQWKLASWQVTRPQQQQRTP